MESLRDSRSLRSGQALALAARVVRVFPNEVSCLRLVTALLMEISEEWQTGRIYLNLKANELGYLEGA